MKSQKQDSVQDYLTSTKLLTSKMKPNNKSRVNKSVLQSLLSGSQSQEGSNSASSHEKRERQAQKISLIQPVYASQRNQSHYTGTHRKEEKSKYENNQMFLLDDPAQKESKKSSEKSKSRRSSKYKIIGNYGTGEEQRLSLTSKKQSNPEGSIHSKKESQSKGIVMPMKKNPDLSHLQVKELINKISHLKSSLEIQISQLQHLLDNTSNYLENIDQEYEKIKQKILTFTSQYLDSAYRQYKNNFPDWSKYENVQHQALSKLTQINRTIDGFRQGRQEDEFSNTYELQKKVQTYNVLVRDVEQARMQCSELRPTITEERLRNYEAAVFQLGKF